MPTTEGAYSTNASPRATGLNAIRSREDALRCRRQSNARFWRLWRTWKIAADDAAALTLASAPVFSGAAFAAKVRALRDYEGIKTASGFSVGEIIEFDRQRVAVGALM